MINQVVLVGRLVSNPTVKENENGTKVINTVLAVPRSYKNAEGVYETDFVDCTLWNGIAENMVDYCKKGDLIAVKGRLQSNTYEKDGERKKSLEVVAEKLTFLTSAKNKDNDNEKSDDLEI